MGLSSVRNFVLECGGFITIESRKGDGTCVSLFLPRAPAERDSKSRSPKRDEISLGNGECVLVVEDDQRVREVTLRRIEALFTEWHTGKSDGNKKVDPSGAS